MPTCKDCVTDGVTTDRPAPFPGPRCATHNRAVKRERSERAHDLRSQATYGTESGDYQRLMEIQGGLCPICRRAKGIAKRLSFDHDHKTLELRGLLCSGCNKDFLGHARDDVMMFVRAIEYLLNPPARQLGAPRMARKELPRGKR